MEDIVEGKSRFISIMIRIGQLATRFMCVSKCCISQDNSQIIHQEAKSKASSKNGSPPKSPVKKTEDTKFKIEL